MAVSYTESAKGVVRVASAAFTGVARCVLSSFASARFLRSNDQNLWMALGQVT